MGWWFRLDSALIAITPPKETGSGSDAGLMGWSGSLRAMRRVAPPQLHPQLSDWLEPLSLPGRHRMLLPGRRAHAERLSGAVEPLPLSRLHRDRLARNGGAGAALRPSLQSGCRRQRLPGNPGLNGGAPGRRPPWCSAPVRPCVVPLPLVWRAPEGPPGPFRGGRQAAAAARRPERCRTGWPARPP